MATSPNYGWLEPDNTDLVKNGALAIRTLGNAIDSTMATMVPKSIVDAKGDLIAGTAADTTSRLAVGNNGETLVADSSTATGLDWKSVTEQYPWTSYTPTFGGLTLGNGTLNARYATLGKTVFLNIWLQLGSTSAITGDLYFNLPLGASKFSAGAVWLEDVSVGVYTGTGLINYTSVYARAMATNGTYGTTSNLAAGVPFTWTTNDMVIISTTYEAS